jgi:hypothetical protein
MNAFVSKARDVLFTDYSTADMLGETMHTHTHTHTHTYIHTHTHTHTHTRTHGHTHFSDIHRHLMLPSVAWYVSIAAHSIQGREHQECLGQNCGLS